MNNSEQTTHASHDVIFTLCSFSCSAIVSRSSEIGPSPLSVSSKSFSMRNSVLTEESNVFAKIRAFSSLQRELEQSKSEPWVAGTCTDNFTPVCRRCGGLMVARWTPDRAVRVRAWVIVLCSWARYLTLTVPLSTQDWVLIIGYWRIVGQIWQNVKGLTVMY